jgi:hypothetical protein
MLPGPQYGHMPPREANILPWEEFALDLIGPWMVKLAVESNNFYALTCIDTVTNFSDAVRLHDKTKQLVTLECNLKIFGYLDIPGQLVVYTIVVQSLWVLIFNASCSILESRMSPSAFATHNQTRFAKDYINQLTMPFAYSLLKEYPSTLTTLPN